MGAKPASASVVFLLVVTPDPFLWVQGKKVNGLSSALSIISSKKEAFASFWWSRTSFGKELSLFLR